MTEERIISRKNPALQRIRKLLTSRKDREAEGAFVADGTKLLAEAVRYCPELETVVLSDGVAADVPEHVRVIRVPGDVMESLSPMSTPQGALFVCKLPQRCEPCYHGGMLLLDGIQDPGNLGTILRTADALDVDVVLLEGCADPYSHKVVRASMGAVFRRDVISACWEDVHCGCKKAGVGIAVTALRPDARDIRRADLRKLAVVIGSEGQGVRKDILDAADETLIIPMNPRCESLNAAVAATIALWQMTQL